MAITRRNAAGLMGMATDIMYVRSVALDGQRGIKIPIYGQGLLVESLNRLLGNITNLTLENPELLPTMNNVNQWAQYVNTKYSVMNVPPGSMIGLDMQDGKALFETSTQWIDVLIRVFDREETVFISQEDIYKLFTKEILDKLDPISKEDLIDGITCLLNSLPTPAAMIILRTTESVVRKYYAKVTGNSTNKIAFGAVINELEAKNDRLTGYLSYLKQKRDEAEHPDKRFKQEEAERMLIQLKELIEEVKGSL